MCKIDGKELSELLSKEHYNNKYINNKTDQYGWLTFDAISTTSQAIFLYDKDAVIPNLYPYTYNIYSPTTDLKGKFVKGTSNDGNYNTLPNVGNQVIAGFVDPLVFSELNDKISISIFTLILIHTDTTPDNPNVIFQIFGENTYTIKPTFSNYGYNAGQCLNLFLKLSVSDFNNNLTFFKNSSYQIDYKSTIYNTLQNGTKLSTNGFYQIKWGDIIDTSSDFFYTLIPGTSYSNNILDKIITEKNMGW